MNNYYRDLITAAIFLLGLFGFVSGEFIISSTLFATAAITSNVNMNRKQESDGHLTCE